MLVDIGRIRQVRGASVAARGAIDLPPDLGAGFRCAGPAEVEASITNTGRFLHTEGRVLAEVRSECTRCLAPVVLPLDVPFSQDFVAEAAAIPEGESDNEFVAFAGDFVDLDPAITEAVLLALPMKPLCRADCPGLCPRCGRNLGEGACSCPPEAGHPGLADLARLLPKKEV